MSDNALRYNHPDVPSFAVSYADRTALEMLIARKAMLEELGLMGPAREAAEQVRTVREWQSRNLGLLAMPGRLTRCTPDCGYPATGYHAQRQGQVLCHVD